MAGTKFNNNVQNNLLIVLIIISIPLIFLTFYFDFFDPYSRQKKRIVQWMDDAPPMGVIVMTPAQGPYKSVDDWLKVGLEFKNIEIILIDLYLDEEYANYEGLVTNVMTSIRSNEFVPILIDTIENDNASFMSKVWAIGVLSAIPSHTAFEPLCKIVIDNNEDDDQSKMLKYNAVIVLGEIGDPNALPIIENEIKHHRLEEMPETLLQDILKDLREQEKTGKGDTVL